MKITATLAAAAFGAVALSSAAYANVVTPPDERVGIDLASPLPEGIYFLDLGGVGNARNAPTKASNFDYNVPIIAWATPWTILGGRIQLIGAAPEASVAWPSTVGPGGIATATNTGAYARGIYNPFLAGQIAWNLGNGFSISYLAGAYIGVDSPNSGGAWNQSTFHQQAALAYHAFDWNFTVNVQYGIVGANQTAGLVNTAAGQNGNYLNYDLALTHTFGKWEIGAVGYGSENYQPYWHGAVVPGSVIQEQFALGGLVGYNFGPVITQFILATDVYTKNYNSKGTTFTVHVIVPLWAPEAPKAVVAKY
jgi:hypothetical protein